MRAFSTAISFLLPSGKAIIISLKPHTLITLSQADDKVRGDFIASKRKRQRSQKASMPDHSSCNAKPEVRCLGVIHNCEQEQ